MVNELNKQPVNVKPSAAPVTPYQKAAEEWDKRIGAARVQAYNWRIIALLLCGLSTLLVIGLIYQSSKSTVTPYVVQVSKEGVVQAIGPAKQSNYTPGLPVIEYFLAHFIKSVRSIPLDPVVAKNQWLEAYAYLRQSAANTLNEIAQKEQPLSKIGLQTVSVQVRSVVPLSKDTYQVRWEETTYSKEGVSMGTQVMTGAFTLEIVPPTDEKQLKVNPLGLFIKQFSWSKDV